MQAKVKFCFDTLSFPFQIYWNSLLVDYQKPDPQNSVESVDENKSFIKEGISSNYLVPLTNDAQKSENKRSN